VLCFDVVLFVLACFYTKSVLVIDGKSNIDDGGQEKHNLRRRRKHYAEIKAWKEKHKLRVTSLRSRSIKKLTVLIV
jgi:hypothetical protein